MLPLLCLGTGVLDISKLSTPDSLACFFALSGLVALYKNNRLSLIVSAILPALRTDFIILGFLICLYEFRQGKRIFSLLSIGIAVALYFVINKSNGNYGWLTIFNFTLIAITPYPAEITPAVEVISYIKPYARTFFDLSKITHFPIYIVALYLVIARRIFLLDSRFYASLFLIPGVFTLFHLLFFPAYMHRFFVFSAILIFLYTLKEITKKASDERQPELNY